MAADSAALSDEGPPSVVDEVGHRVSPPVGKIKVVKSRSGKTQYSQQLDMDETPSPHSHGDRAFHQHGHNHGHSHGGCGHGDHGHSHGLSDMIFHHHHDYSDASRKSLLWALGVIFVFCIGEIIGGILANSLALFTDAAHLLVDMGALALSLAALWLSQRAPTAEMSFGYSRAEVLGAFVSALSIWVLSAVLLYEAVLRFQEPEDVDGKIVFITASVGLIANLSSAMILYKSSKDSINVRAAFIHTIGDSIQNVGVILAGLAMWYEPDWDIIDPIITIVFAILVLLTTIGLLREAMTILMEKCPEGLNPTEIQDAIEESDYVLGVQNLHIWGLTSQKTVAAVKVVSDDSAGAVGAVRHLLKEYGVMESTIEVIAPPNKTLAPLPNADGNGHNHSHGHGHNHSHGHGHNHSHGHGHSSSPLSVASPQPVNSQPISPIPPPPVSPQVKGLADDIVSL